MRILVTFAVDAEFAPWRKARELRAREVNGFTMHEAEIGRAMVDFVITGMGMQNARRTLEAVISSEHTACIGAGFAGSLKPELKAGDIVVARSVQKMGKAKTIESAPGLFLAALESQAIEAKMFLTAERVIGTAEEKEGLSHFGDAVDMESFATLSVASEKNVPAVALRVISDRFEEDMPAQIETTMDEHGRVTVGRIIKHLASHPSQIPALIRFGRQSSAAAETLAYFLEAFIRELSLRTYGFPPRGVAEVATQ